MKPYSVQIVEDDPATREMLAAVVDKEPKLSLGSTTSSFNDALRELESKPDILLVDLGLPDGSGIDLIRKAKEKFQELEILVISGFGDENNVVEAIEAGASGYILKDGSLSQVGSHILSLMDGDSPISPGIARYLLKRFQPASGKASDVNDSTLTERERSVLTLIAKGYSRNEAAEALGISQHTATTHIKHIYKKLSVHSRTEAIFEATQMGLIKPFD